MGISTENRLSRNEMWCASHNHNNMRHIRAKELLDSIFNEAVIYKISIFNEIAPNFTYSQKSQLLKYNWDFGANRFFPINFMAVTCEECTFSFLPVVRR